MANIWMVDNTDVDRDDTQANRNENGETTWRKMIFSYKLNIYLSFDSAIPI